MSARRTWRRWFVRGLLGVVATLAVASFALLLALGTAWGRARVLAAVLEQVQRALPGRLEVASLARLSPFGVTLRGVRLSDPVGHRVLELTAVDADLAPLDLVRGRIVLSSLSIGPGQIDLTDLQADGRGLLAAVRGPRSPGPASGASSPPPYVRIDRWSLVDLGVQAPALAAPWEGLRVRQLQASGAFLLDGAPELTLASMSCDVRRGEPLLARLTRVNAHLARPGEPSELELDLELGAARLGARARGVLPPKLRETDAVDGQLRLEGLSARDMALLLDDPSLSSAFEGAAALQLDVAGSPAQLRAHGTLVSRAGDLQLDLELHERHGVEIALRTRALVLRELRAELPERPLAFVVEASTDLSELPRLPLALAVHSASWGAEPLPALKASGRWGEAGFSALELTLNQGASTIDARGHYDVDGASAISLHADIQQPELRALAAAAGRPVEPGGSLRADLALERSGAGAIRAQGNVRARALRVPGLSLDAGRVDLDVRGPLLALGGQARLDVSGVTFGGRRLTRAVLNVEGDPRGYRLRSSLAFDTSRARLDVLARHEADRWLAHGQGSGLFKDTPWSVVIGQTSIDLGGRVETRGVIVNAGEQHLRVSGSVGLERSDLSLTASDLDVARLTALAGLGEIWTGRGGIDARLRGDLAQPQVSVKLFVANLARERAAPIDARVSAELDAEHGRASVEAALSGSDAPRWLDAALAVSAEFRGGAGWAERLLEAHQRAQLELRALQLRALGDWLGRELPANGDLSASAALTGSLQNPVLHASVRGSLRDVLGAGQLGVEQRLDYAAGRLEATLDIADLAGPWLHAGGRVELDPSDSRDLTQLGARARMLADASRWELSLALERRTLDALAPLAPAALASLALEGHALVAHEPGMEPTADAAFSFTETRALANTRCHDAGVRLAITSSLALGQLEARLAATHRSTELARVSMRAALQIAPALRGGALDLGQISAELASRGLQLGQVPYLCDRVRGRMDASMKLSDPLGSAPTLDASLDATGLSLGAEPQLGLQLRARADRDAAHADLTVIAPAGRSTLSATLPIHWSSGRFQIASDAPIEAHARLDALPIAPLLDPEGAVSEASGSISGQVDVGGTLRAPEPNGQLELRDAELTATALAQPLHGVSGRFRFDRRELQIDGFEARDRDGVLRLSGKVERSGLDALALHLNVAARRFPLRQRGQVVATTSGHAKIGAELSKGHSKVAVQLMDADTWLEKVQARAGIDLRAHPDYTTLGAPQPSADATSAAAPPAEPAETSTSEITLDASDHFWIKREDFAVQLSTRLEARLGAGNINVKGRVEMYRGYLDLMGTVFELDRGSHLDFTGAGALDPMVSITARHENRSSGKTVKVEIGGRGSKPELSFFIEESEVSAGEALEELLGRRGGSNENAAQDAKSFVSGLTAGLLATSARRELGAAAPIIMIEPGDQTGEGRIRAGFELDSLVPTALRQLITGIYVEGIVEREGSANSRGQSQQASTQAGVLLELYFPHQLFSTGQWGPGTTWSLDWGWQL